MSLNKYSQSSSSSSSSSSIRGKKVFAKLKLSLSGDYPRKNAELLSAQYGINLLLVGVALILAIAHQDTPVEESDLLSFTSSLMILQLLWMMWYVLVRHSQRNARTERDVNATTSWIRGGLSLLAVLSLIMDALKIGYYVGYRLCLSVVQVVYPVIHAIHTVAQVHFLWFHIKDVIKSFETFERFGVIHAVFTNLLLWCNGVMSETEHFMNNHFRRTSYLEFENITKEEPELEPEPELHCNCTTSTCSLFSQSVTYLFPFNIEYHIFVSVLLFVMWKNIGRTIDISSNRKSLVTKTQGLTLGPILGLLALVSTIGILVVYLTRVEGPQEVHQSAISMFYIYGIVMLVVMCSAGAVGLLIYRANHMPLDASKNPSRQLDTELLFGSALGSWFMSWCSIVSVLSSQSDPPHRWTNLIYSILIVLEKYVQNLFIIESLYRQQESIERADPELPINPEVFSVASSLPPLSGIVNQAYESPGGGTMENEQEENEQEENEQEENGQAENEQEENGQAENEQEENGQAENEQKENGQAENEQKENGQVYGCQRNQSNVPLPVDTHVAEPLNMKRLILKNIAVLLLFCNVSLWILLAFGCRPQYDNGLEEETFGFSTWTNVLNFAIPLSLFYRMHSVASLFEVFRRV